MKKIYLTLIVLALLIFSVKLITKGLENDLSDDYYEVVMSVYDWKSKLPVETGGGLTLYDINLKGKTLTNFFRTNESKEDFSQQQILNYKEQWKKNLLKVAKNNPKNKSFAHENIIFQYHLVDRNNKPVLNFEIIPDEYK